MMIRRLHAITKTQQSRRAGSQVYNQLCNTQQSNQQHSHCSCPDLVHNVSSAALQTPPYIRCFSTANATTTATPNATPSATTTTEIEIDTENDDELRALVEQLVSYDSLKTAVVDREEDFSPTPRFSQPLLKDVLSIVKEIHSRNRQTHASNNVPLLTPRELLQLVHTLVLPTTDMTIPSHAIKAVLEVVVMTLTQCNNNNNNTTSSNNNRNNNNNNNRNNLSTTPKFTLDDAHVAQDLWHKTKSIQIYYTTKYVPHEMQEWKRSLLVSLNLTLNLYSTVASTIYDTEASKQVVQYAENLLMESGSNSTSSSSSLSTNNNNYNNNNTNNNNTNNAPERFQLQPDVISFNTVMTAWGKSVRRNASKAHHLAPTMNRRDNNKELQQQQTATKQQAAQHAAERAEAILTLLLEISADEAQLQPTAYSYTTAMAAWANVGTPKAAHHVMDELLAPMVQQYLENNNNNNKSSGSSSNAVAASADRRVHPGPTAATLVTAAKVLAHHDTARGLQRHVEQLLHYHETCRVPFDTILGNAILTAYVKVEPTATKDYLYICKHMIEFFDKYLLEPDAISYMLVLLGIRQCLQHWRQPHNLFPKEAERFLQQAASQNLTDTRMYNDVLGALLFHADRAEALFDTMGDQVDYQSHQNLLEAYEVSSKIQSGNSAHYAEKAEQLVYQMENLSDSADKKNLFLRPQTQLYNAAILAWLETKNMNGVERAHAVLQRLLQRYQQRLDELATFQGTTATTMPRMNLAERPNNTSFIPIMAGYSRYGTEQHMDVVETMLQQIGDLQMARSQAPAAHRHKMAPIQQNAVATNVLLDMYAKFSRNNPALLQKAETLLTRMNSVGGKARPDDYSYTIVLKACGAAAAAAASGNDGNTDTIAHTLRVLELAKQRTGKVDVRCYNAALEALTKSANKQDGCVAAEQLLHDMMQQQQHNVAPDVFSFVAVINAWTSVGTLEASNRADQILQEAIQAGQADSFCFNAVIAGFAQLRTPEGSKRAKEVYFSMQQVSETNRKVEPTAFTYQNLAMGGSPMDAFEFLQEMVDRFENSGRREDRPGGRAFSHVIGRWFHHKNEEEGAQKMEQVLRLKIRFFVDHGGPEPTQYEIDSTLKKMASAGRPDDAVDLLDELYSQHSSWSKREISAGAYDHIISCYVVPSSKSTEAANKACMLLKKMEERFKEDGAAAQPSGRSYAECIAAWTQTRVSERDARAEELVLRMAEAVGPKDPDLPRAFNMVLKACKQRAGTVRYGDSAESVHRGARVFGRMMQFDNVVNYSSYAYMLNLTSLMKEDNSNKVKLYEKLMVQCQKAGLVSPSVLGTFAMLAPLPLAAKVLRVEKEDVVKNRLQMENLPAEWTRNVRLMEKRTNKKKKKNSYNNKERNRSFA